MTLSRFLFAFSEANPVASGIYTDWKTHFYGEIPKQVRRFREDCDRPTACGELRLIIE
jgi:hypothetical protein